MLRSLRSEGIVPHFSILLFVLLLSASCVTPSRDILTPSPEVAKVKKIAILPFSSISDRASASETVTNIFTTEIFKSGRFEVVELGNVLEVMVNEGVNAIGEIDIDSLRMMSGRLGVDAIVVGSVDEFDDGGTRFPPVPTVALTVRMVESKNGKIIWSGRHKRSGEDYASVFGLGRVRPISALAKKVVVEIIRSIR